MPVPTLNLYHWIAVAGFLAYTHGGNKRFFTSDLVRVYNIGGGGYVTLITNWLSSLTHVVDTLQIAIQHSFCSFYELYHYCPILCCTVSYIHTISEMFVICSFLVYSLQDPLLLLCVCWLFISMHCFASQASFWSLPSRPFSITMEAGWGKRGCSAAWYRPWRHTVLTFFPLGFFPHQVDF